MKYRPFKKFKSETFWWISAMKRILHADCIVFVHGTWVVAFFLSLLFVSQWSFNCSRTKNIYVIRARRKDIVRSLQNVRKILAFLSDLLKIKKLVRFFNRIIVAQNQLCCSWPTVAILGLVMHDTIDPV